MDLRRLAFHRVSRRKARKGDTAELAAQLAPLEERSTSAAVAQVGVDSHSGNGQAQPDAGTIVVDRDPSLVPKDMMEESDGKTYLGIEPVVLVILGVMLIFIAFIAWEISNMPAK
jgi:hypothetical protein